MTRRDVLLPALASMPSDVGHLIRGLNPHEALQRPLSDQESMLGILSYLHDFECRYRDQLRCVVQEDRPELQGLDPSAIGQEGAGSLQELVNRLTQARAATMAFLNGLSAGAWQRKAVHPILGETSLRFLVQHLVEHDTQFLSRLVQVRQALRGPTPLSMQFVPPTPERGPVLISEEKNERKRTRKWPRKRPRRGN